MKLRLFSTVVALGVCLSLAPSGSAQEFPYQLFERYLEPLAQQIGMPGLAAVIVRNGRIEWEKGYGYADVENRIQAHPATPFPIGGVTQAMTGVLVGICADRNLLNPDSLDIPIRRWAPAFPEPNATVRQVLAHASEGRFRYDPERFTALTAVVESCLGQPYRVALATEILERLALTFSVPGLDLGRPEGQAARALFDGRRLERYDDQLSKVAVPYRLDREGRFIRSQYPLYGLDAASGLVSTARNLADFEIALYNGVPLSRSTINQMWSPAIFNFSATALTMPTGLGWFTTTSSNQPLVWTFGHIPDAASALILKLPDKDLTLVMLANSGGLVAGYGMEQGDVTGSPFVKLFLRLFGG